MYLYLFNPWNVFPPLEDLASNYHRIFQVAPQVSTITSLASGVFLSVLPKKCLLPVVLEFLGQPYKLHRILFNLWIVPFRPPGRDDLQNM
jgi:hypothetical protein